MLDKVEYESELKKIEIKLSVLDNLERGDRLVYDFGVYGFGV